MVQNYEHITKYENILNQFDDKVHELEELMLFFEEHHQDFGKLMNYYYSDQRREDLEDDQQGKLPEDLNRGVLSEDAIYNLYVDYRNVSLEMLENGTQFFKGN